jgi:hypothetical protein
VRLIKLTLRFSEAEFDAEVVELVLVLVTSPGEAEEAGLEAGASGRGLVPAGAPIMIK